jgi:hypothetical protein
MMRTRRLTEDEFKATMSPKMRNVQESATDVLDIWPYVCSVPSGDLEGHTTYDHFVDGVYRTEDGRFDHVLVKTKTKNVYLVVVIDLVGDSFYGHRLLDLRGRVRIS